MPSDTSATTPANDTDDGLFLDAVEGVCRMYEHNGRQPDEDCVRLSIGDARRLVALAREGLP